MATITEDYVSFEIAKLLKEKGFDSEDCFAFYKKNGEIGFLQTFSDITDYYTETCVIAPTLQMAMKWLRNIHNMYIEVCTDKSHNFKDIIFRPAIYDRELDCLWDSDNFPTYKEACETAIKYCLENLI